MRLRQITKPRREPDLTGLINIIFLILIFFMIAGTMRPFSAPDLKLAKITQASAATPTPGRLIAHADGRLTYRGVDIALESITETINNDAALDRSAPFTLIADARLDAAKALATISALQRAGITEISILTERSRQ